jgi:hypothetical protein
MTMTSTSVSARFATVLFTALALAGVTSGASAQDDAAMAPRLHLRGLVTAGGEARLEIDDNSAEDDLLIGFGGAAELEVPVLRYLSVAGGATVTAWQADIEDDDAARNVVIDVDFTPRLRAPIGDEGRVVLYLAVPIGLAINIPSSDYADAIDGIGGELSNGVGLHVGGRAGGQFFVTERFGFVAEAGVDFRAMSHRIEGPLGGDERFMLKMAHFTGQLGVVFAM